MGGLLSQVDYSELHSGEVGKESVTQVVLTTDLTYSCPKAEYGQVCCYYDISTLKVCPWTDHPSNFPVHGMLLVTIIRNVNPRQMDTHC